MSADLYHEALRRLAKEGPGRGRLAHADATATVHNPLCGDRVTIDLALDGDRVAAVGHEVRGCLLCEAAAALVAEHAPGHRRDDFGDLPSALRAYLKSDDLPEPLKGLALFAPARAFRSRHRCVTLPFEAMAKALG